MSDDYIVVSMCPTLTPWFISSRAVKTVWIKYDYTERMFTQP